MIRLVIADDHDMLRLGLARLLGEQADIELVGDCADASSLFALLGTMSVDVLILDISMPGPGIIETLKQLKRDHPRVRTIVLSMYAEAQYAARAITNGAAGYLTKDRSPEVLVDAVRKVHRGGLYVTGSLAEQLAGSLGSASGRGSHEDLSDREFEVLKGIGEGRSMKEIAATLKISPKTVSTYRVRLLEKLGARTNADLVRYTVEHGLSAL